MRDFFYLRGRQACCDIGYNNRESNNVGTFKRGVQRKSGGERTANLLLTIADDQRLMIFIENFLMFAWLECLPMSDACRS